MSHIAPGGLGAALGTGVRGGWGGAGCDAVACGIPTARSLVWPAGDVCRGWVRQSMSGQRVKNGGANAAGRRAVMRGGWGVARLGRGGARIYSSARLWQRSVAGGYGAVGGVWARRAMATCDGEAWARRRVTHGVLAAARVKYGGASAAYNSARRRRGAVAGGGVPIAAGTVRVAGVAGSLAVSAWRQRQERPGYGVVCKAIGAKKAANIIFTAFV